MPFGPAWPHALDHPVHGAVGGSTVVVHRLSRRKHRHCRRQLRRATVGGEIRDFDHEIKVCTIPLEYVLPEDVLVVVDRGGARIET